MENYLNSLPALQKSEIHEIVLKLIENYKPEMIYCFGCNIQRREIKGCFAEINNDSARYQYYLLMVTKSSIRIEHEVQEFVNRNFEAGIISIVVHGIETITDAISQGSRFFTTALKEGILLYSINGLPATISLPEFNPNRLLAKTERFYQCRIKMSKGFLEAAETSVHKGFFNNTAFLLHQTVEQACITVIKVYTAYRSDIHNITRLLNFCGSFSNQLTEIFPREKKEDIRLFQVLNRSYSESRYKEDFIVREDDANLLIKKVSEFIVVTESLCLEKINAFRLMVESAGVALQNI